MVIFTKDYLVGGKMVRDVKIVDFNSYSVDDLVQMMNFKNYLTVLSTSQLCEYCLDPGFYGKVIDSANIMLDCEDTFFLLDSSYPEKVYEVIQNCRFRFQDSNFTEVSNEVLLGLNSLSNIDIISKNSKLFHYREWQEEMRKFSFCSHEEFVVANSNDILVYHMFSENESFGLARGDVVSSLNYFCSVYPRFFDDSSFYQRTISYLDSFVDVSFYKRRGKFYQYAKEAKDSIQKLKGLK